MRYRYLILVLLCIPAMAQNSRWDFQATTALGSGQQLPVLALPGAQIAIYACSSSGCGTLATTYNSATSTSACPNTAQVVLNGTSSCTAYADGQGRFGAWLLPTSVYGYAFTFLSQGRLYGPYSFTVGGGGSGSSPVTSVFGRIGAVLAQAGDYVVNQITGAAPLASPVLTGSPQAPTQSPADSSNNIATTNYVNTAVSNAAYGAKSWTVGSTAVQQYTFVMQDGSGNIIPANLTGSNGGLFVGIAQSSGAPGTQVSVVSVGTSQLNFENTPVSGDVVISGTTTTYYGRDNGGSGLNLVQGGVPALAVVVTPSGSTAKVFITGVGTFGYGNFVANNKVNNINFSYGGLNLSSLASIYGNNVVYVAGFNAPGILPNYTPATTITTGTTPGSIQGLVNGTNATFTFPYLANSFAVFINGTKTRAYTTTGTTLTFTSSPASGSTITANATAYDLGRGLADNNLITTGNAQLLVLPPGTSFTCNAAPLPNVNGSLNTTSIVGVSREGSVIQKQVNCGTDPATFDHKIVGDYQFSSGVYANFSVNASGIDTNCANWYAFSAVIFANWGCAAPGGSGQVVDVGASGNSGWTLQVSAYSTFAQATTVHQGSDNTFDLTWSGGSLTNAVFHDRTGSTGNSYSQYTQTQFYGPGLASCTVIPYVTPTFTGNNGTQYELGKTFNYANMGTPTIINPGSGCTDTAHIFLATFDNPVNYGMNLEHMTDSSFVDAEIYSPYQIASMRVFNISSNNSFTNDHSWSGAYAEIIDQAGENRYVNFECDAPGGVCFILDGPNGSIVNTSYDSDTAAYQGASGIFYRNGDNVVGTGWYIQNFMCANNSVAADNPYFLIYYNYKGVLSPTNPIDPGVHITNYGNCDGTNTMGENITSNGSTTADLTNFQRSTSNGIEFDQSKSNAQLNTQGIFPDYNPFSPIPNMCLHDKSLGGSAIIDPDPFCIDGAGNLTISGNIYGGIEIAQIGTAPAPSVSANTPGTSTISYAVRSIDTAGGHSQISAYTTIANSNATLGTAFNAIMPVWADGTYSFAIYRGTNSLGLATGYLGILPKSSWDRFGATNYYKDLGGAPATDPFAGGDTTGAMKSNSIVGPSTAPSGSCGTNGQWILSQDGHATFCSAGTWVTKI